MWELDVCVILLKKVSWHKGRKKSEVSKGKNALYAFMRTAPLFPAVTETRRAVLCRMQGSWEAGLQVAGSGHVIYVP